MIIILFGPPGIGKTTIIGKLKSEGKRAIDLEDIYPSRIRFQLPNMLAQNEDTVYLGAADLDPKRKYPNTVKVLLYADQATYDARRAARDAMQAGKGSQAKHLISDWKTDVFDTSIDTSKKTADTVVKELLSLDRKGDAK